MNRIITYTVLAFIFLHVAVAQERNKLDPSCDYFFYALKNVSLETQNARDYFDNQNPSYAEMLKELNRLNIADSSTSYYVLYFRYNLKTTRKTLGRVPIYDSPDSVEDVATASMRAYYNSSMQMYLYGEKVGDWQNREVTNDKVKEVEQKLRIQAGINKDYCIGLARDIHEEAKAQKKENSVLLVMEDAVVLGKENVSPKLGKNKTSAKLYCRAYISSPDKDLQAKLNQQMQLTAYDPNKRVEFVNDMISYLQSRTTRPKSILIFASGFEPMPLFRESKDVTSVPVADMNYDFTEGESYWQGNPNWISNGSKNIAVLFRERIRPEVVHYASGDKSVATSGFVSMVKIVISKTGERYLAYPQYRTTPQGEKESFYLLKGIKHKTITYNADTDYEDNKNVPLTEDASKDILEKCQWQVTSNPSGFKERVLAGEKAGSDLLNKIRNREIKINLQTDSVHIVCHSMGYATALGMINVLKQEGGVKKFGSFYILAPENANMGELNLSNFNEVYQYGSKEHDRDGTPKHSWYSQDAIAPQMPVKGLEKPNAELPIQYGRAYIPIKEDDVKYGWYDSHSVKNYWWIFDLKNSKDKRGEVKQR